MNHRQLCGQRAPQHRRQGVAEWTGACRRAEVPQGCPDCTVNTSLYVIKFEVSFKSVEKEKGTWTQKSVSPQCRGVTAIGGICQAAGGRRQALYPELYLHCLFNLHQNPLFLFLLPWI